MVSTLLVRRRAWNLSMAMADVRAYITNVGVLLESRALRSQKCCHSRVHGLGT
ncbi:hypothetical protein THF5G08_30279 [Vibrio jasicida]|nr:hypothetical protein THF5G08_30279 [Vibrio jasicida]